MRARSSSTPVALLASMLLLGSANSVMFAVAPPAGRQLGLAEWQVGLVIAFSAAAYMIAAPWWGRVSDIRGRRPVVVVGMAGFGLGGLVFAGVFDIGLEGIFPSLLALVVLIGTRVAQSLISGGVYPAVQAHIADNTPAERRAVALSAVTAAFALGSIAGPAAAGLLVGWRITLPLYLIGLLGLAVALWDAIAMKRSSFLSAAAAPRLSPRDPRVAAWIGVAMVYFVSVAGTQQVLGFVVQDRLSLDAAATARATSWIFMIGGAVAVLFQFTVIRRSRWSSKRLTSVGLVGAAVMQAALGVAGEMWQFLALAVPLGIAFACVTPGFSAAVSLAVDPTEQGAAAGLVAAAQAGGFLVGPVLFAAAYQLVPALPFLLGLGIALFLLCFVLAPRPAVSG